MPGFSPNCCESGNEPTAGCCEPAQAPGDAAAHTADFGAFLTAANQPGLIDMRAKKLMAIALSISQRCRPCLVHHIKGALAAKISKAEVDEAANLAVAFAGCPAMMLYKEVCQELGV